MDLVSEKVGGDFYILPSSVHELLVIPRDARMEISELEKMVCEVNVTQVSVEERMSDHVYAYDSQTHEIYRADMEMEHALAKESIRDDKRHQLEKSTERKEKVRESVKEKLVAKQKVVADVKKDAVTVAKSKNRATE